MSLEDYKRKRDFGKTQEPAGEIKESGKKIYVMQKHYARNLHWDLRLEKDGVLKSWAIPKNPLEANRRKILAIEVADHALEYGMWEGVIPKGQYGAGKVERWDIGTFETIERTDKKIIMNIKGKKLKGIYVLVKFKPPNNWLFFKKKE